MLKFNADELDLKEKIVNINRVAKATIHVKSRTGRSSGNIFSYS